MTAATGRNGAAPLLPLAIAASLFGLVLVDGPTTLRLALALATVTLAAGSPIVALLRLPRGAPRTALLIGVSLASSLLVAEALVLVGRLTPVTGAAGLLAVTLVGTVARRLRRVPAEATEAPADWWRRQVATLPRRPAALTAGAVVLWTAAALVVEPRTAGDAGMISALPPVWWLGIAVLAVAFVTGLRGAVHPMLATVQVILLVAFLYGIMTVAEPYSRIPTSYTHVGLVDYLVRDHRIVSSFDARYSWPGSLALGALLTQLAGVESAAALVRWAVPFFVGLWALGVYAVASALGVGGEHRREAAVPWLAVALFLVLNWVGQDYFSSQALHFFLVLVVIAAIAAWFPRRVRGPRTPRFLPGGQPAPTTGGQRTGLFLVVTVIAAAVASSHQLSPFMLTGALAALWLVDRRDVGLLPLVSGALTLVWLSWGAQPYWVSHLTQLTEDVGQVSDVITAGTSARIAQSSGGRQLVLVVRLLLSGAACVAAGAAFLLARRRAWAPAIAALVVVPFGAVAMQEYGGELGLRIFLFSSPFIALLLASVAVRALEQPRRRAFGAVVAGLAVVLLVVGFVIARYGNEQFEQVYAEDVAAVREFYRVAPKDARVIGNNTSNPFRMGPFHDYRAARFAELAFPDETDIGAALRHAGWDEGYVLVTEAGIHEAQLRDGARPGWEDGLHDRLLALGADEVFRDGRAALYELHIEGAERPSATAAPSRSRAGPEVRRLLGVPALGLALLLLGLVVVRGARRMTGRAAPGWWLDAAAFAATFGLVGVVAARFLALT